MFLTILKHQWQSFYRAHFFQRNLAIKFFIGFFLAIVFYRLMELVAQLPGLMQHYLPEKPAHEWFFRYLLFLYPADLITRLAVQSVPKQAVVKYLHLPVKRSRLAFYTIIRSWFSIYNFYLLVALAPFLTQTIYQEVSVHAFWQVMAGCYLLGMVNHSITMYIKTRQAFGIQNLKTIIPIVLLILLIALLLHGSIREWSFQLGMAFFSGNHFVFFGLALLITSMLYLAYLNLQTGVYSITDQAGHGSQGNTGSVEKLFLRWLVLGPYWDMEWKMIMRNKRSRMNFLQTPVSIIIILALLYLNEGLSVSQTAPILVMALGSYGFIHLQYVFSWESRFFDYIATRQIDMTRFVRSKYYFYVLMAILQFIILTPFILWFNPGYFFPLLALLLYITGPGYWILFYNGLANSTRIDPNKTAFFNFEGTSGTLFFTIILVFMGIIPFMIMGMILPLPGQMGFYVSAGLTGLFFILASKFWTNDIGRRFIQKKYHHLNKFREKQ